MEGGGNGNLFLFSQRVEVKGQEDFLRGFLALFERDWPQEFALPLVVIVLLRHFEFEFE